MKQSNNFTENFNNNNNILAIVNEETLNYLQYNDFICYQTCPHTVEKNFLGRKLKKKMIDKGLMLHWYLSLLIELLHVITFKLQTNEICDMKDSI